jgi:Bacteriophage HK97-gp10, putative tail-component
MASGPASGSVVWTGLNEYMAELEALPENAETDVYHIHVNQAEDAADEMRDTYPVRTGLLRASVKVEATGYDVRVTNSAPYATQFEFGKGGQPGGKVFWPILLRHRREATRKIVDLLEGPTYEAEIIGGE